MASENVEYSVWITWKHIVMKLSKDQGKVSIMQEKSKYPYI